MTKPAETGELERARSERMGQEVADARWNLRKRLVSFCFELKRERHKKHVRARDACLLIRRSIGTL